VDEGAEAAGNAPVKVVLYTALGCPSAPSSSSAGRTAAADGVHTGEIDVTLRPDLLAAKGIRSVPVVEVGARLLFGLVTTKELAKAIAEAREPIARR